MNKTNAAPSEPILSVNALSVGFHGQPVTRDVTFQLHSGRITALVGESGSGKSLTSSAIMGLLPPGGQVLSGTVMASDGTHWIQPRGPVRTPLGQGAAMIFQDPMSSLNPSTRVGWQVAEGPMFHENISSEQARNRVERLFQEVDLSDPHGTFEKYPHELSGGQKQRVMIALALAGNPRVLIADEPTTALDVTVQKAVLQLLKRLCRDRGLAVLFITHDLDVVREIADAVLVMNQGQILETGDVQSILDAPQNPYTQALLQAHTLSSAGPSTSKPGTPLIEGRHLHKSFVIHRDWRGRPKTTFTAVDDVSVALWPGERVGLVGESGSGKSTIGRLLLGLEKPDSGVVLLDGKPMDPEHPEAIQEMRRSAQLVFQDPFSALSPRMTIGNALREVLQRHGRPESDAKQLMHDVGLQPTDLNKRPGGFSGGQRQRIVIARALAIRPRFLVLDESVAALDAHIQQDILKLLHRLGEERGLTYLFISHDLAVIRSFCPRVFVLQNGKVVESGDTETIWSQPQHPYTQQLLNSRPGKVPEAMGVS